MSESCDKLHDTMTIVSHTNVLNPYNHFIIFICNVDIKAETERAISL